MKEGGRVFSESEIMIGDDTEPCGPATGTKRVLTLRQLRDGGLEACGGFVKLSWMRTGYLAIDNTPIHQRRVLDVEDVGRSWSAQQLYWRLD
jgi:hypothetical protein